MSDTWNLEREILQFEGLLHHAHRLAEPTTERLPQKLHKADPLLLPRNRVRRASWRKGSHAWSRFNATEADTEADAEAEADADADTDADTDTDAATGSG